MICPFCHESNSDGIRNCKNCGTPLYVRKYRLNLPSRQDYDYTTKKTEVPKDNLPPLSKNTGDQRVSAISSQSAKRRSVMGGVPTFRQKAITKTQDSPESEDTLENRQIIARLLIAILVVSIFIFIALGVSLMLIISGVIKL